MRGRTLGIKAKSFAPRAGLPQKLPGRMRRLRRRSALRRMLGVGLPKSQSIRPEGGPPTEAAGVYAEIASEMSVAADTGRGVAKEPEHSPRGRASYRSCRGVCGDCVGDERCGGCWPWGCRRGQSIRLEGGPPTKAAGCMHRLRRRSALRRMLGVGLLKS